MKNTLSKLCIAVAFVPLVANAELVQNFKDPTFSGNGWSTQVLTLEQMRQSAVAARDAKEAAAVAQSKADAANTPLAKFLSLFQGQVYSQLATQLTNDLFSTTSGNTGTLTVDPNTGTTVTWTKLGANGQVAVAGSNPATQVSLTVNGPGQNTTLTVPLNSFAF